MPHRIERRQFLQVSAVTLAASLFLRGEVPVSPPENLDHILLGTPELQAGIDFVEKHTGVRATFGGVHPSRGTQNALLSLGERRYLEIIAPDPKQQTPDVAPMVLRSAAPLLSQLQLLREPRLVGWAAHPGNVSAFTEKLRVAGIKFDGPTPGSRKRPDGQLLKWQIVSLADTASGLLPFFIEWGQDSAHPSVNAPKGCGLLSFAAETQDPEKLAATLKTLNLDLPVRKAERPRLQAVVSGPKGNLDVYS